MREAADEALAKKAAEAEAARQAAEAEELARQAAEGPGAAAEAATAEAQVEAEGLAEEIAIREATAITFGTLLPDPQWATETTLRQQKGVETALGRITGTVTRTERKSTQFGDKLLESIALIGEFHALATRRNNEIIHGSMLFLTNPYSMQIERALKDAEQTGEVIKIDVEVGFQATGKQPRTYGWTITHFLNAGRPSRALRELMAPRGTRLNGMGAVPPVLIESASQK